MNMTPDEVVFILMKYRKYLMIWDEKKDLRVARTTAFILECADLGLSGTERADALERVVGISQIKNDMDEATFKRVMRLVSEMATSKQQPAGSRTGRTPPVRHLRLVQ